MSQAKTKKERSAFAKNLRLLRDSKNLSRREFGEKIGVSQFVITAWEESRSECSLSQAVKIAQFFEVTTDNLLNA
jgi:DNA-binding XRE family transcriptional regulator